MGPTVQVDGSLNTPLYRWPKVAGITLCVLAPIAYALDELGWQGLGRFRILITLLRYLGPTLLLAGGVAALLAALAARMALAARRRDLEVVPAGFALIGRRGRRDYEDGQVAGLGVRSRSAARGTVPSQRGRASIWVDGRDGEERIDLAWEYPDALGDPLADFFGRLLDRAHASASRAIDSGGTISGEGWELSGLGLRRGRSDEVLTFGEIAQAEYHAGELRIWRRGEVEPCFRVPEGSRNDAILRAVVADRTLADQAPVAGPDGLGRVLFERRWGVVDRLGLWLLCGLLAASGLAVSVVMIRLDGPSLLAVVPAAVGLLALLPALMRQVSVFRCHEGAVSRSGLFGVVVLPYEDIGRVVAKEIKDSATIRLTFKPIPGRGRKAVTLHTGQADEGLETIRLYVPGPIEGP